MRIGVTNWETDQSYMRQDLQRHPDSERDLYRLARNLPRLTHLCYMLGAAWEAMHAGTPVSNESVREPGRRWPKNCTSRQAPLTFDLTAPSEVS